MAAAWGPPPRAALAASRLLLHIFPSSDTRRAGQGPEGQPGAAAAGQARGDAAEGSPGKFIKHLKWILTRLMDQVQGRNCTLKCRDENKDKRTRRVVIRPCQL